MLKLTPTMAHIPWHTSNRLKDETMQQDMMPHAAMHYDVCKQEIYSLQAEGMYTFGWHYLSNVTCLIRLPVFSTALLV